VTPSSTLRLADITHGPDLLSLKQDHSPLGAGFDIVIGLSSVMIGESELATASLWAKSLLKRSPSSGPAKLLVTARKNDPDITFGGLHTTLTRATKKHLGTTLYRWAGIPESRRANALKDQWKNRLLSYMAEKGEPRPDSFTSEFWPTPATAGWVDRTADMERMMRRTWGFAGSPGRLEDWKTDAFQQRTAAVRCLHALQEEVKKEIQDSRGKGAGEMHITTTFPMDALFTLTWEHGVPGG